jgi:hypothetical protein
MAHMKNINQTDSAAVSLIEWASLIATTERIGRGEPESKVQIELLYSPPAAAELCAIIDRIAAVAKTGIVKHAAAKRQPVN